MHYIYTKEGIASVLDLNSGQIDYYYKKSKGLGYEPRKKIGGVYLYDIDLLFKKEPKQISEYGYTPDLLNIFKRGVLFE